LPLDVARTSPPAATHERGSAVVSCLRPLVVCAFALGAFVGLGCGGSGSSEIIARVDGEPIAKASLDHWISILRGGPASGKASDRNTALRKQIVELLISARWLIGEARSHGISTSQREVRDQVSRVEHIGFVGGTAELSAFLKSTGETVADVELQARDELASAGLRRFAVNSVPPVTDAQVAVYYKQHKPSFIVPERREARFLNSKTKSAAETAKREIEAGRKDITTPERRRVGEIYAGARVPPYPGNQYEEAIDASKPGVVSGPYHIGNDYWLYKVVKVIPSRQRGLAEVAQSIRRRLTSERTRQALTALVDAWTTRWKKVTDCKPGYVVPGCKQYDGPAARNDPFGVL
jgi:foldase protein PrsA